MTQSRGRLKAKRFERIGIMIHAGKTITEIAEDLGVSGRRASAMIREAGHGDEAKANLEKRRQERVDQIRDLAGRGFSRAEVARKVGCSRQNVHALAKKHGIDFDGEMSR